MFYHKLIVGVFSMTNINDGNGYGFFFYLTNNAVIPDPISPQTKKFML